MRVVTLIFAGLLSSALACCAEDVPGVYSVTGTYLLDAVATSKLDQDLLVLSGSVEGETTATGTIIRGMPMAAIAAQGTGRANATYTIRADRFSIGASVSAFASGTASASTITAGGSAIAEASVQWTDTVEMRSSDGLLIPNTDLVFNYALHGTLSPIYTGSQTSEGGFARFEIQGAVGGTISDVLGTGPTDLSGAFNYRLDENGRKEFQFLLQLNTSANAVGDILGIRSVSAESRASFANSLVLSSITLADGTTPEENGYTLSFASGERSPNVTAVPEPCMACGISFLLTGSALTRLRRRKTQRVVKSSQHTGR